MFACAFLLVKPGLFIISSVVGKVTIILGYSGGLGSLGNQKWFSLSDNVNYWAAKLAWIQGDASVLKLWEDSKNALVILLVCDDILKRFLYWLSDLGGLRDDILKIF